VDNFLIFTKGTYGEHLKQVDEALERLRSKNMAVSNAVKSFWAVDEVYT
jgi:hypothetical protein